VRDEVCFGLENLCRPADEIMARQAEALAYVGLPDAGDLSIFDMSGGQKQRVSIAAVLAARPRLLVLDEPTANLDPAGMAEVFAVLHRLNREYNTTIVMVEHRVDELAGRGRPSPDAARGIPKRRKRLPPAPGSRRSANLRSNSPQPPASLWRRTSCLST
jgi:ABC-type ATPase involved in cell division